MQAQVEAREVEVGDSRANAKVVAKEEAEASRLLFGSDDSAALAISTIIGDESGVLLSRHLPALVSARCAAGAAGQGNVALLRLDLRDRGMQGALPVPVLELLGTAEYFNLSGNSFKNVDITGPLGYMVYRMQNWKDAKELDWENVRGTGNQMRELPGVIGHFTSLQNLNLSRNLLMTLPDAIGNCKALACVNLDENKLATLPDALFCCESIKELSVQFNHLQSVPPGVGRLCRLETLNLEGNRELVLVADELGNCACLKYLTLSYCHLEQLPDMSGCTALLQLQLQGNYQLTAEALRRDLTQVMRRPPQLEYLELGFHDAIDEEEEKPKLAHELPGCEVIFN